MADIVRGLNPQLRKSLSSMKMDNVNSWPDMLDLQANNLYVPLFVYASEQREMSDHFRMKRGASIYQGRGVTVDRDFLMTKDLKWTTPLVFQQPKAPTAGHIFGEVYLVEPEVIYELDSLYERGAFARRHRRTISYRDPADKKKTRWLTSCFMYTHIFDIFKERIKNGDYKLMDPIMEFETGVSTYKWFVNDDKPNMDRKKQLQETSQKIIEAARETTEAMRNM